MKLTTDLYAVTKLGMSGDIPLLSHIPLHGVHSDNFTFTTPYPPFSDHLSSSYYFLICFIAPLHFPFPFFSDISVPLSFFICSVNFLNLSLRLEIVLLRTLPYSASKLTLT